MGILRIVGEAINLHRFKQGNKYFQGYKKLNTFDHPYHLHKRLDREPFTTLPVKSRIILNEFQ